MNFMFHKYICLYISINAGTLWRTFPSPRHILTVTYHCFGDIYIYTIFRCIIDLGHKVYNSNVLESYLNKKLQCICIGKV